MSRTAAATIALITAGLILASALARPSQQQPAAYLPVVLKPEDTPTPTTTLFPEPTPTATPTPGPPTPTNTPTLPPPTYNNCQADPNPSAAPDYPVRIVTIDKAAETVTLRNVTTGDTIDLTGWEMCSITGNQHHPIFGTLAPGQSVTFPGPAGFIWNNSERDDGALYNDAGQLVSYYEDT
jgi:hypothetical protein